MPYLVRSEENFKFGDDDTWNVGEFDSFEQALDKAKEIVDQSLRNLSKPGMTGEALYEYYKLFGEDSYIIAVHEPKPPHFSAWSYAKLRCEAMDLSD